MQILDKYSCPNAKHKDVERNEPKPESKIKIKKRTPKIDAKRRKE